MSQTDQQNHKNHKNHKNQDRQDRQEKQQENGVVIVASNITPPAWVKVLRAQPVNNLHKFPQFADRAQQQ